MLEHLLVFAIVAVCLGITIRVLYRVFAGKSSTCSLCDQCPTQKSCADKPADKPAADKPAPKSDGG
jgi:hypothetical protein